MRVRKLNVRIFLVVSSLCAALATHARAESQFFGPNVFGRNPNQLFNLGALGLINGFNFNQAVFPQDVAGTSRLANPVVDVEPGRRILVKDPRSGFVTREVRVDAFGNLEARNANAFGNPQNRFFSRNFLDSEAEKQATKFFLENPNLGSFNNINDLFNGNVRIQDVFAANNLAARTLGPQGVRGTVQVQCLKDDAYGRPTDFLAGQVNATEAGKTIDPSYSKLSWKKRCLSTVSYALNLLVDCFHPEIQFNESMIDENTGVMTIPNLRNHFSLRDLAIIFGRHNNTDICNNDPPNSNPPFPLEDVLRLAMDPAVVNATSGNDKANVNNNYRLEYGVDLSLPSQLQGRIGSPQTDLFFIDNKDSGVATSGQTRQVQAFTNGTNQLFVSTDTNSNVSGPLLGAQNVRQSGRNNLGNKQHEVLGYCGGRMKASLAVAPDAQGKMALAEEAPATAAHAGGKSGVTTGMCTKCHPNGPAIIDQKGGPYDVVAAAGSSGIQNLSANFQLARTRYQAFLQRTGAFVEDEKKPGSAKSVAWDAFERANLPKSQAYASGLVGWPPQAVEELLRRRPEYKNFLQLSPEGDLDSVNLASGGKCFLKSALRKEFGSPRSFGQQAPPALASTTAAPGTHVQ